jgi:hypothetical protein
MDQHDEQTISRILATALSADGTHSVLTGWVDFVNGNQFSAKLKVIKLK